MTAKQILAVAVLLAASILAWQVRGIIMVLPHVIPAAVTHDPGGTKMMLLPSLITLNMGGGKFVCKLTGAAYSCSVPPVPDPVRGAG